MAGDGKVLEKAVDRALSGKGAHAEAGSVFEGLDWTLVGARPEGVPHSIFQLLNHLTYWQEWVVQWLDGKKPAIPKHASGSWPGSVGPADRRDWQRAVKHFEKALRDLSSRARKMDLLVKGGNKSRLEMLQTIASHNSYHIGQVVVMRRMLGSWPPPSGGLTW